ncbi:MAG: DUF3221 domain-containing protein [Bacillota bacterium]
MKRILLLVFGIVIIIGAVGCSKSIDSKENGKIGIRGQITKVLRNESNNISGVLVEGEVESDTSYDKASVEVAEDTKIYKGNTGQKLSVEDLKENLKVEVVFEGPVAESYPVQGKAKIIRVID